VLVSTAGLLRFLREDPRLWWGALATPGRAGLSSRAQLDRKMLVWATPVLVSPPMFGRDG